MPRQRSETTYRATAAQIKAVARQLMAEKGTVGLSLRAIAREMGVTAPALYSYYDNLDDLITALILDAFNALADAVESAAESDGTALDRLWAATMAYRHYALDYPVDFQLIYGSPIPGYEAPREITVPASTRTLLVFAGLMQQAIDNGDVALPDGYRTPPASIAAHIQTLGNFNLSLEAGYATLSAWPRIHGIVMLEIFGHIGPAVGDMDSYFEAQIRNLFEELGANQ